MKRNLLIKHLQQNGCVLRREGSNHSLYESPNGIIVAVPRHPNIVDYTAKTICKQLGIPVIGSNWEKILNSFYNLLQKIFIFATGLSN